MGACLVVCCHEVYVRFTPPQKTVRTTDTFAQKLPRVVVRSPHSLSLRFTTKRPRYYKGPRHTVWKAWTDTTLMERGAAHSMRQSVPISNPSPAAKTHCNFQSLH